MQWKITCIATLALGVAIAAGSAAAGPQASADRVVGEITAIDAQSRQVALNTDQGQAVTLTVGDATVFRKVPPGAQDLSQATPIAFVDLAQGDRVGAMGKASADGKMIEARSVLVMVRAELTEKQKQEQEDWQKRGVSGVVSAVDVAAGTFTIKSGQQVLTVQPSGNTEYLRYAPDSVKFSDAVASTLAEVRPGDQARVLGEKNPEGTAIAAERIVSGSFPQFAATIGSINAEKNEIVIRDLVTKKTLSVRVTSDSTMKRLPPPVAAGLAKRYGPARGAAGAGTATASGNSGGADGGPSVGAMLADLPALAVTDLKPGDAIMLSSTKGSEPDRVTAIMLLAGVEPLLTASPTATRDILGVWNLSGF